MSNHRSKIILVTSFVIESLKILTLPQQGRNTSVATENSFDGSKRASSQVIRTYAAVTAHRVTMPTARSKEVLQKSSYAQAANNTGEWTWSSEESPLFLARCAGGFGLFLLCVRITHTETHLSWWRVRDHKFVLFVKPRREGQVRNSAYILQFSMTPW